MPAIKAPPLKIVENTYSVSEAAVRLKLREEDEVNKNGEASKKGEKWLRDGVNLHGWPHYRLGGQLRFSESDLAEIQELNRNKPETRGRRRSTGTRKRPSVRSSKAAVDKQLRPTG
ncbi:hypothetical protein [Streptomyces katrae]|uniref:hypothetical protein n=1 Tax=Streptomyces katrae TaxID=68223 RepID=UPI0004C0BA99|nr:hypothetical protein [Streptomyces katrae]